MTPRPAPTVAAVVLNHDYADFVLDAVRSVLDQRIPYDEVVVVDDGSTDDSVAVLRASGLPVRLVEQPNSGPLGAALGGLAAVTSDYVHFLDADDRALPELMARVRSVLGDKPVKVQFQLLGVDRDLVRTGSVFPAISAGYTTERMRADNAELGFYTCPPTSGNLFRRDALEALDLASLDPRESIDGVAAMVAPHLGEVATLGEPLGEYRVHGRNHSRPWAPDVALLRGEVDRFWERWRDAVRLVEGLPVPVADHGGPAYVAERELMIAVLERRPVRTSALRFLGRVRRSNLPLPDQLGLVLWTILLVQPVDAVRRHAIVQRRSAGARSAWARRSMALVRTVRRVRAA